MVNCWFGARWFGNLLISLSNNPFYKGIQSESKPPGPNQHLTEPSAEIVFVGDSLEILEPTFVVYHALGCWIALATASLAVVLGIAVARGQRTELRVQFLEGVCHIQGRAPGPKFWLKWCEKGNASFHHCKNQYLAHQKTRICLRWCLTDGTMGFITIKAPYGRTLFLFEAP